MSTLTKYTLATIAAFSWSFIEASFGEIFWALFVYCIGVAGMYQCAMELGDMYEIKLKIRRKTVKGDKALWFAKEIRTE